MNKYLIDLKAAFGLLLLSATSSYAVTISGTAAEGLLGQDGFGLSNGQRAILVVDTADNGFSSVSLGDDLNVGSTLGADDYILATTTTQDLGFANFASYLSFSFNLGENGIAGDQSFGLYIFDGTTGTTAAAGYYGIGTDVSWTIPTANGETWNFSGTADSDSFLTLPSLQASSSVVPEPSTYAALAGLCALSFVMVRRRRA